MRLFDCRIAHAALITDVCLPLISDADIAAYCATPLCRYSLGCQRRPLRQRCASAISYTFRSSYSSLFFSFVRFCRLSAAFMCTHESPVFCACSQAS